jgi:hypothetical protein
MAARADAGNARVFMSRWLDHVSASNPTPDDKVPRALWREDGFMCRSIKTLHNFKPPATDEEVRASAVQFVRKLSGFTRPSRANAIAFTRAVDQVAQAARELIDSLVTSAPPRDREVEAAKARAKGADRFR